MSAECRQAFKLNTLVTFASHDSPRPPLRLEWDGRRAARPLVVITVEPIRAIVERPGMNLTGVRAAIALYASIFKHSTQAPAVLDVSA